MPVIRGVGRPTKYVSAIDEQRLPGVTTVTNKDIEGLLIWANRLGLQGKDHRDERDKAAGSGTLAHLMVENEIHGLPPLDGIDTGATDPELLKLAQQGFQAYRSWHQSQGIEYVATEMPLISETYRYGGTFDAVGKDRRGVLLLLDWKTSGSIHEEHLYQVAAYRQLWEENYPDQKIEGVFLLRFGKEQGDFHCHGYPLEPTMRRAWEGFLHLRELYDIKKELRKAAT